MKKMGISIITATFLCGSMMASNTVNVKSGWGLYGLDSGVSNMEQFFQGFENDLKLVWTYDTTTSKWKSYSPDSGLEAAIDQNVNIDKIESIAANEGFWIKSNNSFNINLPNAYCPTTSEPSDDVDSFIVIPTISSTMFENTIVTFENQSSASNGGKYFFSQME